MGARRLGQDEQYFTVREILSEASTLANGTLSRERSDFYRFGYATLGLRLYGYVLMENHVHMISAAEIFIKFIPSLTAES